MADFKRQHYAPKCYFKPFSVEKTGAAINLFNISRYKHVRNAPIKGQCARDYFYGEELVLEKWLQQHEGDYARVIRKLRSGYNLDENEISILRSFAYLQHSRTETAIRRRGDFEQKSFNTVFEGRADLAPEIDMSDRAIMLGTMRAYFGTCDRIIDLKTCIIKNVSGLDFITSDDPAILVNRFYCQQLKSRNFGISSSGVCLFMPLTPRLSLACYDGGVYTISDKRNFYVEIRKDIDIHALNELQYLKAAKNIYYSSWDARNRIEREFNEFSPARPKDWFEMGVWVQDDVTPTGVRYRRATDDEKQNAKHRMITSSALHPIPSRWLSKLRYRTPVQTYFDGSALGHVRRFIWEHYVNRRI